MCMPEVSNWKTHTLTRSLLCDKLSRFSFLLLTKCWDKMTRKHTNNSYFLATEECFLFTVRRIIPNCSQCGNHPHCLEIVSSAPASSLKNICFTVNMLENESTMTLRLSHHHRCQRFCHFTESGEVKTIRCDAHRLLKTLHCSRLKWFLPLAHVYFPAGSIQRVPVSSAAFQHSWNLHLPQCRSLKMAANMQNYLFLGNDKKEKIAESQSHHLRAHVLERFATWKC